MYDSHLDTHKSRPAIIGGRQNSGLLALRKPIYAPIRSLQPINGLDVTSAVLAHGEI
jgi:hypothetical protein